jgi:hypothetical protein
MRLCDDISKGKMLSACIEAPFDKGKEALESKGYRIISLEENAGLRIQEGRDSFISRWGNWTREGVIYVQKKGKFLTKKSPIMDNAKEATDCHRNGKDYYLTNKQVEEALADCVELSGESIPTNRFKDEKVTVYAFGDIAEQYGNFLKETGINGMPVWLADTQDKPFARQMWFRDLDDWSELGGDFRGLDCDYRVRGVHKSAEGIAKNSEVYTPAQISKILNNQGITGKLEKEILNALRQ